MIYGPLPPPESGVEGMTRLLLTQLASGRFSDRRIAYHHFNNAISANLEERERLTAGKVLRLAGQVVRSAKLALRSDVVYYPISQNTIGLVRDVALVAPYRMLGRRRIVHLHGGELDETLARQPRLVKAAVQAVFGGRQAHGIVLAPRLRACLAPLITPERISIVENAVPDPGAATADAGPLRVLFLSTLMRRKGYRELVTAMRGLHEGGEQVELLLAGEPHTPEDAAWLAAHAQRAPVVRLGQIDGDEKRRRLREADVLVLPSTAPEGQPLTILEGMAAGCAVVATDRGGIADTVSDDAGVVLAAVEGERLVVALQDTLSSLAGDRRRLAEMKRAARARWETRYRPENFATAWFDAVGRAVDGMGN